MRKLKNVFKYSYFTIAFILLFTVPVHAYIDPSVMTYAIQVIAGSAIAVGTVIGLYWRKIAQFFRKLFRVRNNKHTDSESDDIYVLDSEKKLDYTSIKDKEIKESKDKYLIVNKDKINNKKDSEEKESVGHKVWCVIRDLIPSILLSSAISFMLFAYAPLEIYMNNKLDFWYDYELLLPQVIEMVKWAVIIGIVFYITCFIVNKKLYQVALLTGLSAFIILYIHGNYFASNLPTLDGTEINWVDYTNEIQISILICLITIAVIGLVTRLLKMVKMSYFIDFVCITISIMLVVSLMDINTKKNGTAEKSTGNFQVTSINEFNYSTDENFIIFMVDAMDSETFNNLLNWYPEYREVFKDFTYYPDTVCAYPFTSRSVPFILSGQWFENQESYSKFEAQAMSESPLLSTLENLGYRLDMYESEFLHDTNYSRYSNVVEADAVISDDQLFRKDEMELAMFKYAPYFLKENYEISLDTFDEVKEIEQDEDSEDALEIWPWEDVAFYQRTQSTSIETTEQKVFKFIHLEGGHVPYNLDEFVNNIDDGTYTQKQQAVITMIASYLSKLKEAGVYDNSRIIIMADHGYDETDESLLNRDNPVLLIKNTNEDHEMLINESPISYDDLQGMYQNLLNGLDGNSCFEGLLEDNDRRRFLNYGFSEENHMVEYYQTGSAKNLETMVETGNIYEAKDDSENEGE